MENLQEETRLQIERNKVLKTICKNDIFSFLEHQKNQVIEGFEDGYKLALFLKLMEEKIKKIKSEIMQDVITETLEPKKYQGYEIANTSGGRYSYDNNQEWCKLNDAKKQLEQDMQKAAKSDHSYINEETGEIIQAAIYKPNKTSYKILKIK